MSSPVSSDPDQQLAAEQEFLARSRRELARMRERTLSLDAHSGDALGAEALAVALARRAAALEDDPRTTLFFGRLDTDGTAAGSAHGEPESWHIGRRHVSDEAGDPLVIDWRAGMATAFYRATRTEPMGVVLRRRFGVERGQVTAFEDEHLQDRAEQDTGSRILADEIERPRAGPMRDIVATIQPEQDEIVRADASTTVCVQGAPGTGKTAVGLHRAAWLLYAHRERLARSGVLVVGPNRAFLDHIGAVLPALGEVRVGHTTVQDLVADSAGVAVRGTDPTEVAVLKGDARLAEVLHRAVWSRVGEPLEALVLPRGSRRWRVPAHEVRELVEELRSRGVRYDAARQMLPQRLAHALLLQMERAGDSPDDRVQDQVARATPTKRYADGLWPRVDPRDVLLQLWSDPTVLSQHADGVLTADEQRMLLWDKPPRGKGSARWSAADAVLLDELADVVGRTPSLGHVVLDEAQDLSPMQLRAVGRRCATGAATVLGDIAQGTTPWATTSWAEALDHLGKPGSHLEVLDRGFRVPAAVIEFAARLLPSIAPGLGAPVSVRENRGRLDLVPAADARAAVGAVVEVVARESQAPGTIGVIVADASVGLVSKALQDNGIEHGLLGGDHGDVDHQVDVVPATVAKGLEFDRVVVLEPTDVVDGEPDRRTGLRRLYVVVTRAVSALTIVHSLPLPQELDA